MAERLSIFMSSKLKNSRKRPDRPFDPRILAKAKKIVDQYQIVIAFEDEEYYGRGVELPQSFSDGKTADECIRNTKEALLLTVASMIEDGETPPAPAVEGKRDQQVNIRLTSQERLILETRAKQTGASGVSDYIRAVALNARD
jgi:predicted RNase H-like HicB family nuclease